MSQRHLVVGSGSIALRHLRNLRQLFPQAQTGCVSASGRALAAGETGADHQFTDLTAAQAWAPTLVVIASPAPAHLEQAAAFAASGAAVLIEKPLCTSTADYRAHAQRLQLYADRIEVGYNLRRLSSAVFIARLLVDGALGRVQSVLVNVGQYLPSWRPQSDYRRNVSAQRSLGGGVLLELSHELDYLRWLFGDFQTVYCLARTSGTLDLDVEDCVDALLSSPGGPVVQLHMDFLQRTPMRTCRVIAAQGEIVWDLMANRVDCHRGDNSETLFDDPSFDRNQTYLAELDHLASIRSGTARPAIGLAFAAATISLVDAMRASAARGAPVSVGEFL